LQVTDVFLLKFQIFETGFGSATVAGFDEVAGYVDADDILPQAGQRNGSGAVDSLDPRLAAGGGEGWVPIGFYITTGVLEQFLTGEGGAFY
jgi:hypothetical protein